MFENGKSSFIVDIQNLAEKREVQSAKSEDWELPPTALLASRLHPSSPNIPKTGNLESKVF